MKALIVYDTKHGNTKQVAELIAEGIRTVEENEVDISNVSDVDLSKEAVYDLIVIGSPNHVGSYTGKVKKFIKKLADSPLKGNSFAAFDTYMGKDFEKAVKKLENQVTKAIPDIEKAASGLSIQVGGMKGPIVDEELPKCKEFGQKLLE